MTAREAPAEERVWQARRTVYDPGVGENAVDLGLVYRIACAPRGIEVDITMTMPVCPAIRMIAGEVEAAIRDVYPVATRPAKSALQAAA